MHNILSDYTLIDLAFKEFIKDKHPTDLIEKAIFLEDFLLRYFNFSEKLKSNFQPSVFFLREFIVQLEKSYKKNEIFYKKDSEIGMPDNNSLVEEFYCYKLCDFEKFYKANNVLSCLELKIYLPLIETLSVECSSIHYNYVFRNIEYSIQLKIDFTVYQSNFSNKILNILHEDLYPIYRERSPIFNIPQKINYQELLVNILLQPKTNDFNFHWIYGEYQELHSKINCKYCLKCHERGKDSCNHGLKNKNSKDGNEYSNNAFGQKLHGCPLGQYISESIKLYELEKPLAALAMIMIKNPLVVLTGYRICNDCVKSCIFQKQTPVDVPSIETSILSAILNLEYGVEIYILLTQWNPLNEENKIPKSFNGKKILVVGLGPSGISASYHLLRLGFDVVALDAVRIESVESELINNPIKHFTNLSLESRQISGFGGVMEYGITSRWNKNYLKIIHIMLSRNKKFSYYDGVRFGSNYELSEALQEGEFSHIVLANGCSKQKVPENLQNDLVGGVKLATDFLMSLQLGGAYKLKNEMFSSSIQIRLPAVVLGCGLTAIDTATEVLNYYVRQVLKVSRDLNQLIAKEVDVNDCLNGSELKLLTEFNEHAKQIKNLDSQLEIYNFLEKLGGVRIIYHKNIQNSGAYKINHEEFREAMKRGVKFVDNFDFLQVIRDTDGSVKGIKSVDGRSIDAKSVFIGCGSSFDKNFFEKIGIKEAKIVEFINRLSGKSVKENCSTLIDEKISVIGDANPQYKGSVVKAILSGRVVSQEIEKLLLV